MTKKEQYDPKDKFEVKTDSETLKKAADFAKQVKKEKKDNVDSNK